MWRARMPLARARRPSACRRAPIACCQRGRLRSHRWQGSAAIRRNSGVLGPPHECTFSGGSQNLREAATTAAGRGSPVCEGSGGPGRPLLPARGPIQAAPGQAEAQAATETTVSPGCGVVWVTCQACRFQHGWSQLFQYDRDHVLERVATTILVRSIGMDRSGGQFNAGLLGILVLAAAGREFP